MALRQTEVQLGHLCNDRCVFCISGDRTHEGLAPLLPAELIVRQLDRAYREGDRRVTFLGGEPTIQPIFMQVFEHAVRLGFEEIVVFTNGSMTGRSRSDLMDRAIATGAPLEWRFSFQGATQSAHEATTRRKGSFAQLLRSIQRADERDQKITINMCVVRQNYESVDQFPTLLAPYGVHHLHLDMLHPDDMPPSSIARMGEIMPRLSHLADPLRRMVAGFDPGFPVNIGNLPHCIAPDLFPWIEHGGQPTLTTTADIEGRPTLNDRWNKYEAKESNKTKPERCNECVFETRCTGVFTPYHELYGSDELRPVTADDAARLPHGSSQFSRWALRVLQRRLAGAAEFASPFTGCELTVQNARTVRVNLRGANGPACSVDVTGPDGIGFAAGSWFRLAAGRGASVLEAARQIGERLLEGRPWLFPPGEDVVTTLSPRLRAVLRRLREAAPFGQLSWKGQRCAGEDGRRLEIDLEGPDGEQAEVWFDDSGKGLGRGYRISDPFGRGAAPEGHPGASPALVDGIGALMKALASTAKSGLPDPPLAGPPGPQS